MTGDYLILKEDVVEPEIFKGQLTKVLQGNVPLKRFSRIKNKNLVSEHYKQCWVLRHEHFANFINHRNWFQHGAKAKTILWVF